jgi:hypothetical protein
LLRDVRIATEALKLDLSPHSNLLGCPFALPFCQHTHSGHKIA